MAFNISSFKSTIDSFGGVARSSLFEVRIADPTLKGPTDTEIQAARTQGQSPNNFNPFPPTFAESQEAAQAKKIIKKPLPLFGERELSFFCKSANIPGISFNTYTLENVAQLPRPFPTTMNNAPFTAVFMVDSDHQVLTYFHRWMQSVLNYGSRDPFAETGAQLPFEVGYKNDYARTLEVRHYSTESSITKYYEVQLDKAFPVSIGDLELAWESNDSYLTLPVTFAYDNIFYSGTKSGTPKSRFSRGRNLLDTLASIAGFSSVVRQTFKSGSPTSIQDAINRLTRVRNSYDNISRRG